MDPKDKPGWCVEYCVEANGDPINGLDADSLKYQRQFLTKVATAQNYASYIAACEPCPCVLGDIAIHNSTWEARTGKWRIDDEPETVWVEVPPQAQRMVA